MKFTYLYDVVEFTGTLHHFNDQDDPYGDEITLQVEDPASYADLQKYVPGLPTLLRCETYSGGISVDNIHPQYINRIVPFEPWPTFYKYAGKEPAFPFHCRDYLYNMRQLAHTDRVRIRGRFIVENGHPQKDLKDPAGNDAGFVWFELHPFDWTNILLLPVLEQGSLGVRKHGVLVPGPLYSAVYTDEIHVNGKTDDHYAYLGPVNAELWHDEIRIDVQLDAPTLPPGVDPTHLTVGYAETIQTNWNFQELDQVRNVSVNSSGIRVQVLMQVPPRQLYEGIWIGDYNDPANNSCVFAARYDVFWLGRGGHLWHSIRGGDAGWSPLGDVNGQFSIPGPVGAVATSSVYVDERDVPYVSRLNVLFATLDGHLWHTIRNPDGSWTGLGDVNAAVAIPGPVRSTAAAAVNVTWVGHPSESNFFFVTQDGGLWHTIRNDDGSWTPAKDLHAAFGVDGPVRAVSATNAGDTTNGLENTHLLFATEDGHLWHSLRSAFGHWTGLGDVNGQFQIPGPVRTVATAWASGEVHFLFTTDGGHLWHSIRNLDGTWTGLGDVIAQLTLPPGGVTGIPLGAPAEMHMGEIMSLAAASYPIAGQQTQTGLQVVFATDDGHVWMVQRDQLGNWQPLDSVTGQFQNADRLPQPTGTQLAPARAIAAATDYLGNLHVLIASDWNTPPGSFI